MNGEILTYDSSWVWKHLRAFHVFENRLGVKRQPRAICRWREVLQKVKLGVSCLRGWSDVQSRKCFQDQLEWLVIQEHKIR